MPSQIWITVLCQFCGNAVERTQRLNGKAYCEDCEIMIFGSTPNSVKTPTFDELIKERKDKEKEIFLRVMSKLFRKLRL
jgi:thymidine kinase